jgi:hypothetical protein
MTRELTDDLARAIAQARESNKQSLFVCPLTGRRCEGDLAYLCEDYGCARKAGLSPHSAENL